MSSALAYESIMEYRTDGSAMTILDLLKNTKVEDLIIELYISAEDEISYQLIKRFEKQLIYACMKPKEFRENLHKELKSFAKFISENKLYHNFLEFCHLIYTSFDAKKEKCPDIFYAYQDLLLQQYLYLAPVGKIVYGVSSDNTLLLTEEPYSLLDYPLYKAGIVSGVKMPPERFIKEYNKIVQEYRKLGYNINTIIDLNEHFSNDQNITNMIFSMAHFIDENTLDIFPEKFFLPATGIKVIRKWKDTDFYKNQLKQRRFLLPPKGVWGIYKNSKDYSKIFFKEVFLDDRIYLLYKVLNSKDEGFCGFFDTKTQLFYSIFRDTTGENVFHTSVENFILENYYHLTCNVEIDRKRNSALLVVNDINDKNLFHYEEQPVVQYIYKGNTNTSENKKGKFRTYEKGHYMEVDISISPYIRKLPIGATASAEAIAYAREMGYSLAPDETFVRPFKRKAYKLKRDKA